MVEYIDRDSALEIIQEKQKALCPTGRYGRSYVYGSDREAYDAWEDMLDKIEKIPAAGVAPVVHGRWNRPIISGTKRKNPFCYCTNCACPVQPKRMSKYCPNCGAKMDKEAHDGE